MAELKGMSIVFGAVAILTLGLVRVSIVLRQCDTGKQYRVSPFKVKEEA